MTAPLPNPPPEVKRISKLIGLAETLALVEAYGGTRLYIPSSINPETHTLVGVIGLDAALKLAAEYSGNYLSVPVAREWRVVVYRSQKMSYTQIALKVGCCESQVYRILKANALTQSAFQLNLFE